ncbi:hypothetical protein THAOC_02197 [Thalassiosira oceanica]|uniref:Uncharacterized protein n=1 Tax=Thalassiosira oceanica TaxID=159749 RepID=K0TMB6_THAOC|nr:hypothetical protein THAOC_02197 [Thalassiosira oceanica]|eukprot:EJK76061.1 hypothetical protein THAOC_02197 [Thalassiosira oceanica]
MIVTAMSRRLLRAPGGLWRPSESRALPTFLSTIYLMMCAGRGDQRSSDIESPRLDGVRKIRRHGLTPPECGGLSPPTRVGKDGFLRYRLAVGTILAVKVIIPPAPSAALPDVPRSPVPPPTPPPSPVQPTFAGGAPLRPTFELVAYNLPPPTPAALPCRIATISNIVRSSFPTHFRRRSALVAKRFLSSRPAAAFARAAVLTDVAVSRSFVRMNAEKISDTLFASPATLAIAHACSGGAP